MNHLHEHRTTRRDFLRQGGTLAAGVLAGGAGWTALVGDAASALAADAQPPSTAPRKRALRIAHLTDIHIQPELAADKGLVACLEHLQRADDKPELIINGGDAIMDSLAVGADRAGQLWKLWADTWRQECSIPLAHCLGNHDIWGWDKKKSATTGEELRYGKAWWMEVTGLAKPYHSFDRGGWHFVSLDSVFPNARGVYEARFDEEQLEWLAADLQKTAAVTPVCVVSHIPILSASAFFAGPAEANGADWRVPGSYMHIDARRVKELFAKHPNVRLCLSGHLHLVDRVDYNGVAYLCNGAVSGNWWKGKRQECDNGYAVIDLFDDGSFERQYIEYGWKARQA